MKRPRIALFGYYPLGREVAKHLALAECDFVVVDNDDHNLARARENGLQTAKVDYTLDSELEKIGIGRDADIIFCLLPEDAPNVFLTISARALSPELQIISVTESADSARKLKAAGADKVIDPYEIVGRKIFDFIHRPIIADILDKIVFGQEDLNLAEVEVPPNSFLDRSFLLDLDIRERYNLIVVGVVDKELGEDFKFASEGYNHKLDPGDVLLVIGPSSAIENFRQAVATSSQRAG